jgi:microcystin-dependent protein
MASPSKPSDFSNLVLTSSATLCDRFKAVLLSLPSKLYDLANYMLDADGNPSKEFAKDLLANTGVWSIADIKPSLSPTTPVGWVECEGQSLSRTTYADLFAVIGSEYGDGDGSITFNAPDLRGYTLVARNESGSQNAEIDAFPLGTIKGAEECELATTNYPETTFEVVGWATAHGDGSMHRPASGDQQRFREALGHCLYHEDAGHTNKKVSHDPDGSSMVASTYSEATIPGATNEPFSIMQPSFAVRYLIYTGYFPAT